MGVVLFFIFLPLAYPIVYTAIYNTETPKDIPVVVVDESRSPESRRLSQMIDATDAMHVYDYAANINDARNLMNEHECYGILLIPSDYAKKICRGEQGVVTFYSDMGLLLRYRAFLSALTDVQLAAGTEIQQAEIALLGLPASGVSGAPVLSDAIMMGDPTQGFASFIMPGVLILIIHQSLILGVAMLAAGGLERRRRNGGIDPMAIDAGPLATILGKMLCYLVLYIPVIFYVLHIVPLIFSLPHIGHVADYVIFIIPMIIGAIFMGMVLSAFVKERESSMLVIVFSSIVFLFLSGLTWPRYAMNQFWIMLGDCIPATWGVEGFVRLNSNGSPLYEQSHQWCMLWVLAGIYMIMAYIMVRYNSDGRHARLRRA